MERRGGVWCHRGMNSQLQPGARWMRNAICFLWGVCGITAFAILVEAIDRLWF